MSLAARLAHAPEAPDDEAGRGPRGPYLRLRTQAKRRLSGRVVVLFLVAASLLFTKVWERTVANSLSMERDHLARDVRSLENRIRITRDLEEQAAFRNGVDLESLAKLGFQNPDPARVVDVDLAAAGARPGLRRAFGTRILESLRRALPQSLAERVVGLPAAPVEAGGTP
ncbi:MAG TPA: hypothetical protein VEU09_06360 [Candidatus Binatia bacterium]|nr:hypothetical protein [Candidatus Binatia bacterium]